MKLQRVIMPKMSGEDVKFLQTKLKQYGFFTERIDGFFGQNTLLAVSNFQRKLNIKTDGVVGPQTWSNVLNYNPNPEPELLKVEKPIDIPHNISFIGENGLKIYDCLLSDDEYLKKETNKNTLWLHHTAGGSRPDWTIGGWEKDYAKDKNGNLILDNNGNPKPLKVGTSYIIGRKSSSTSENIWDGKILRAFDDKFWAWHLGISGKLSEELNSRSIGIELCNYGPLILGKDNRFYNYVNKPIDESDVVELDIPFKGYTFWEKYTNAQLESTRKLILHLEEKWGLEIQRGIYNRDWFEYNEDMLSFGGIRSHGQIRRDKFDIFPQKEMIQMLNSI